MGWMSEREKREMLQCHVQRETPCHECLHNDCFQKPRYVPRPPPALNPSYFNPPHSQRNPRTHARTYPSRFLPVHPPSESSMSSPSRAIMRRRRRSMHERALRRRKKVIRSSRVPLCRCRCRVRCTSANDPTRGHTDAYTTNAQTSAAPHRASERWARGRRTRAYAQSESEAHRWRRRWLLLLLRLLLRLLLGLRWCLRLLGLRWLLL
jgi:hypothetical protein